MKSDVSHHKVLAPMDIGRGDFEFLSKLLNYTDSLSTKSFDDLVNYLNKWGNNKYEFGKNSEDCSKAIKERCLGLQVQNSKYKTRMDHAESEEKRLNKEVKRLQLLVATKSALPQNNLYTPKSNLIWNLENK